MTALTLLGIICSIGATGLFLYPNLANGIAAITRQQQGNDVRAAATITNEVLKNYGMQTKWSDAGDVSSVTLWVIPEFTDTALADELGRVIGSRVALLRWDPKAKHFAIATGNLTANGARLKDWQIDGTHDGFDLLSAGQPYADEETIGGVSYSARYVPFLDAKAGLLGALLVAQPRDKVDALLLQTLTLIGLTSLAGLVVFGTAAAVVSRYMLRAIPVLSNIMKRIVAGEMDLAVPFCTAGGEIGEMARSIEVFRTKAEEVGRLTENERAGSARRATDRATMMLELQRSFGEVVDAAIAGDFTRRVEAVFPDPELNKLADSINRLVETVDRGLTDAGAALTALASADLTAEFDGVYEGAFATLRDSANAVRDKLAEIIGRLRGNSRSLKDACSEIAAGAADLSRRSIRQASTVEETATVVARISGIVLETAARASMASLKAQAASKGAADGVAIITRAHDGMARLSDASARISDVVGLIEDIAFQTNLLALNASVEAARAGDAGKGFAVVAVEVRRLAQSAAQASTDVKRLIEQSSTEVEASSQQVATATKTLNQMRVAIDETSVLMVEIAKASDDQAASFKGVNSAIRTLDEMTQHNVALVEETSAAIEQSEAQAIDLDNIVGIFKIEKTASKGPTVHVHPLAARRA